MQQYFTSSKIEINSLILLDKKQSHHIKNVMRMKKDDNILISDQSKVYLCRLNEVNDHVTAYAYQEVVNDSELPFAINLYLSLIKQDKWEWAIQKACELGVSRIIPLITQHCVVKANENINKKLDRYNKIALEACEQAQRLKLVEISMPIKLMDLSLASNDINIVAYEKEKDTHISLYHFNKNTNLIIGPEGGFSEEEINHLTKLGIKSVSLGKRIYRAETAALYALSIIGADGEKSSWKK